MINSTTFKSLNQICLTLTTCTVLGLTISKPVDAVVMYSVTNLGTLGGSASSAFDINDKGQVVGSSWTTSTGEIRAFLWDSTNGMQNLGTLGGDYSQANSINNRGQVVGFSETGSGGRAFLWDSTNGMQNLGTLESDNYSAANSINNQGQVVGRSETNDRIQPFLWDSTNGMQNLGILDGYTNSAAYDINNNGQVVGFSSDGNSVRATLWDSNGIQNLGSFGTFLSQANSINNKGQVVGVSSIDDGGSRAFLWDSTNGLQDLGTLDGYTNSYASDINNNSQIVGYTFSDFRALLWEKGTVTDLNTLIDPNSGWILGAATAINNQGQIVGEGLLDGQNVVQAFLLTPISQTPERVPEPTCTLGLLTLGVLGAGSLLKRK